MLPFEEERKFDRLMQCASGMRGHQIRHQILLLMCLAGCRKIAAGKFLIAFDMRLSHPVQHRGAAMFRRHLELAADMIFHQFP